ncbi:hypothetical protein BC830DRAFT_1091552 [Chytriomyces sp. MP71]|nr:hypothetical protein BC830DRAFT_1091552 [Chytriomyces sp. MP71]
MLRTPSANSTATGASNRVRKPVNYAELNGNDPTSTYSSQPAVSSVAPVAPIPTEIPAPIRPFPASPVKMVANSAPYAPPNRTSSIHVSPPKPTISVTPKVTIQLPLSKASKREDSESCSSHGSGANTPVASARSSPNKPVAPFFPTSASQMRSSDSLNGAKKRAPLDTSWKELYEDLYEKTSVIEQEQENRIREFKKRCEELEMHVLSLQKELMAIKRKEPKFESVSTNDMVCVREGLHSGDGLDEQVIGIQVCFSKINVRYARMTGSHQLRK